ncbi:hypothetical protein [Burkholderia vietnamiensis]|uniref:SUKH-4 immunity protein of toxin-antitoxin system n=1 Tax=Burkholderia vietnamiensis TaxID=60552 RepID=A0AAW7T347_BURVI|nr:hypothetical protein [Burkholderia vietnamiensis]KVG11561.1 hypothetical protein WJ24_09220 [Burkholderia vietnamiensis]MBR7911383.1 hypothetical protein [Burkholderia vietnamiensis]MBR8190392.1 hypothetical protein [Burkholderia vietnamiensis]MCA7944520.1 hypothetical protein [Burkholderia vietnamiensis]MCA8447033.1 hypothetical protein [Burkholderia vietnamiensis]
MTEHADCPYQFHTSVRLFAMVHKPLDTLPMPPGATFCADMEMLCQKARGGRLISAYLSPLDAVMGSRGLLDGDHFWPIELQHVDTRTFMEQNGSLNIAINYAYAAKGNRLVVDERGYPLMLYAGESFNVPVEQREHFSIAFSSSLVEDIEQAYKRVGLPQFVATLDAMREWSHEQIADAVEEATSRMPPTVSLHDVGDDEMNQGAIYDPESGDWMFADFE